MSNQARAIIADLVRTERGSEPEIASTHVWLLARAGRFYWVRLDGGRLLRGNNIDDAEQLQESFTETMARAGRTPGELRR
jgi:hypothetical protein